MKIVGVTTLDCVRANKFVSELTGKPVDNINIPDLDKRVQDAGTEVVNAKGGKGSATLSMAYAGARLGSAVLKGLAGSPTTECAYVQSSVEPDMPYFTSKVTFGPKGVQDVLPIGELNDYEKGRLAEAKAQLKSEIETGVQYAETNSLCGEGVVEQQPTNTLKPMVA